MWAFLYGIFYFFLALLGWDEDLPRVGRKARQSIRMELAFLGLTLLRILGIRKDNRHGCLGRASEIPPVLHGAFWNYRGLEDMPCVLCNIDCCY